MTLLKKITERSRRRSCKADAGDSADGGEDSSASDTLDGSPYSSMVLPCSPYLSLLVLAGISSEPVV